MTTTTGSHRRQCPTETSGTGTKTPPHGSTQWPKTRAFLQTCLLARIHASDHVGTDLVLRNGYEPQGAYTHLVTKIFQVCETKQGDQSVQAAANRYGRFLVLSPLSY